MDPLSTAASGIAVISLTIQLAGSVREIHRFLRSINEAPKELKRLVDLLEQLDCILNGICALQAKQNDQNSIPDMHAAVIRALQTCQSRLKLLTSIVDKAKNDLNKSGKVSKTWASLKLTLKKKDMDEFESRLEQAMIGLQTAMMMNIAHVQVNHTQTTSTLVSEISLLRSSLLPASPVTEPLDKPSISSMEVRTNAIKQSNINPARNPRQRQVVISSSHTTLLGTFVYRTIYTYRNLTRKTSAVSKSKPVGHETIFTFIPSFFSRCVEMRLGNDYGKVSSTLNSYQVVKADDSMFDWNGSPVFLACQVGDIEALKLAFNHQGVSPFVVDENGECLLHEAASSRQADVCKFLIEQGLDSNSADWVGRVPLSHMVFSTTNEELPAFMETLEALVSYGQTNLIAMDSFDYWRWLTFCPPQAFEYLLNQELVEGCIKDFENWERLRLLGKLLEKFGATLGEDWKRLIRRFVSMNVNLYDYADQTLSLIDHCFLVCNDPVKSRFAADEWLEILSSSGVDVRDYLQMEMRRHSMKPPLLCRGSHMDWRRRLVISLEETPTVYWEWWVDPSEHGSLVCNEFGDLGRIKGDGEFFTPNEWPYSRPYWLTCDQCVLRGYNFYFPVDGSNNIERAKVLKQAENRFERRMQKRGIKQRKAMGVNLGSDTNRGPKVPGAWID